MIDPLTVLSAIWGSGRQQAIALPKIAIMRDRENALRCKGSDKKYNTATRILSIVLQTFRFLVRKNAPWKRPHGNTVNI